MSKTNNTQARSNEIQAVALSLIDQQLHDGLPNAAAKPLRVVWQHQLVERTGCVPFTARAHIVKALNSKRQEIHQKEI